MRIGVTMGKPGCPWSCIQLSSLASPARSWNRLVLDQCPATERAILSRFYESDCRPLPISFATKIIDTLSTVSRSHHAGWPTYRVDSRWTITRPLMEVRERCQRTIPGCYCGCGFASNYVVNVRRHAAESLSASASEIWWIRRLSTTAFGV